MIIIQVKDHNPQKINLADLQSGIETTLATLNQPEVDITLRLTDDIEIKALNEQFRGISDPTDVLSFNQDYFDPETNRLYLGDIVISVERAFEQVKGNHQSLQDECLLLVIHGTLHLLGYDHSEPGQKEEMWAIQEKILQIMRKSIKRRS